MFYTFIFISVAMNEFNRLVNQYENTLILTGGVGRRGEGQVWLDNTYGEVQEFARQNPAFSRDLPPRRHEPSFFNKMRDACHAYDHIGRR